MLTIENNSVHFQKDDEQLQLLKQGRNEFLLLQFLRSNPTISQLTFYSCGLTDNDLKIILNLIKKCPHILSLNLSDNKLTDKGFGYIGQQLPHLGLHSLTLNGNIDVTNKGILDVARGVRQSSLHSLSLSRLLLRDCINDLISTLQGSNVEQLDVSTTGITEEQAFDIAMSLNKTAITVFNAESNLLKDDGTLVLIKFAKKLRSLNISYNSMTGYALAEIAENVKDSQLTELNIAGTTLLPQALTNFTQVMAFNKTHNQPNMLSQAYLVGFTLYCMERQAQCTLPRDVAITIANFATQSNVQSDALVLGRNVAYRVKPL